MIGGMRGAKWALNIILSPIHLILHHVENRIKIVVAALVFIILMGYGVWHWILAFFK